MLNKKEYLLLELMKLYKGEKSYSELDRLSEKIIQSGEEYQLELEEAERLRDDDNETFDLKANEQLSNRTKLANELERYNKWRRGAEDIEQPNPTKLGMMIDEVVKELRKWYG